MPQLVCFASRVLRDFFLRNHGLLLTGAVAYNMMLSLIPLSAVILVVFSHFYEHDVIMSALTAEVSLIAPGFGPTLTQTLESFLANRGVFGWIGGGILLFFSSMAFRVLEDAIALIFHRPIPTLKRKFWVSALIPYLFILIVAAGLILVTSISALLDSGQALRIAAPALAPLLEHTSGPLLYATNLLSLILLFTLLYKIMPVATVAFHRALAGGATATLLWEITRHLLVAYFNNVSLVNLVYGSMATIVIVLLTMEAIALILLLGAQVIADLQRNANLGIPWHLDPEQPNPPTTPQPKRRPRRETTP